MFAKQVSGRIGRVSELLYAGLFCSEIADEGQIEALALKCLNHRYEPHDEEYQSDEWHKDDIDEVQEWNCSDDAQDDPNGNPCNPEED